MLKLIAQVELRSCGGLVEAIFNDVKFKVEHK